MKYLLVLFTVSSSLFAAKHEPVSGPPAFGFRTHTFEAPAEANVILAAPWNVPLEDGLPARIGRVINLNGASLSQMASPVLRSSGAARVRLRLEHVSLPTPDAVLRVVGGNGVGIPFGKELIGPAGELWTPSVEGDTIAVRGDGAYEITAIAHVGGIVTNSDACFADVSCHTFPDRDVLSKSIAALEFVSGAGVYACTGGLINGADGDRQLLTANHCISTASEAASLEALWDSRSTSCGASAAAGIRTTGSTLLVTSASTDVTLLRMNSLPGGRYFMGWDTAAVPAGTQLYRISHPAITGDPLGRVYAQAYSLTSVNTTSSTCTAAPRPAFLYSTRTLGGVGPGASGAPVIIAGGYIVGQLLGGCGPPTADGCSNLTSIMDGAFAASYPTLQPFIDPDVSPNSCVPSSTSACMLNNRFRVTVRYRNGFDNGTVNADAKLKVVSGFANSRFETAFFYFGDENNVEMMVKILDQGNTNASGQPTIAVLFGSATPLRIQLTIVDSLKNVERTYASEFNQMRGGTDFIAFLK